MRNRRIESVMLLRTAGLELRRQSNPRFRHSFRRQATVTKRPRPRPRPFQSVDGTHSCCKSNLTTEDRRSVGPVFSFRPAPRKHKPNGGFGFPNFHLTSIMTLGDNLSRHNRNALPVVNNIVSSARWPTALQPLRSGGMAHAPRPRSSGAYSAFREYSPVLERREMVPPTEAVEATVS